MDKQISLKVPLVSKPSKLLNRISAMIQYKVSTSSVETNQTVMFSLVKVGYNCGHLKYSPQFQVNHLMLQNTFKSFIKLYDDYQVSGLSKYSLTYVAENRVTMQPWIKYLLILSRQTCVLHEPSIWCADLSNLYKQNCVNQYQTYSNS